MLELQHAAGNASVSRMLRGANGLGPGSPSLVSRLPNSPATVLGLQRSIGNARVAAVLGERGHQVAGKVQRDPAPAPVPAPVPVAPGGPAQQAPGENPVGGPDAGWAPIAKLIEEQLGPEKIKEYAKSLAGKGVDLLIAQVKDATSEKDFVAKAQVELLGTMLSEAAKKDAEIIASSDAAKAFRERLLTITSEQPAIVIAAAIAAAAVAYLANVDIPEISKKIEVLKGLTAEGKLDIGKIQQLTVQQASAALKYTSTHFSAGVSAGYVGEGDKKGTSAGANLSVGDKEIQFKGSLDVKPDGTVKVDLGQAIDLKKFGLESGVSITGDKMAAVISVKIGDKETYVSGKTTVGQDGQVSLDLGIKAGGLTVGGKATGLGGDKPAGEGSLTGTDIFGLKGLDAKAQIKFGAAGVTSASGSVTYGTDTKHGRAYISFSAQTVAGEKKDEAPIGAQGVIGVGFTFGR